MALTLILTVHRGRRDIVLDQVRFVEVLSRLLPVCYSSSAGIDTVRIELVIESLTSIDGALTVDRRQVVRIVQ